MRKVNQAFQFIFEKASNKTVNIISDLNLI